MASALPPTPSAANNLSWSGPNSSTRSSWRNSDAGAAPKGSNNTRGRSSGRGARGGRGGRGGGGGRGGAPASRSDKAENSKDKPSPEAPPLKAPSPPAAVPAAALTAPSKPASSRPRPTRKASDNKPSRKAPEPTNNTSGNNSTSTASNSSVPRSSNRQRRSKGVSTVPSKASLSSESSQSQAQSERSTGLTKDLPPHLAGASDAPSFDIRHDINALVERVRAVAMDRPHTPGSHFDWASDDDDSLPELPDWGLSTSALSDLSKSVISPILEDALKPLPNIEPATPLTAPPEEISVPQAKEVAVETPSAVRTKKAEPVNQTNGSKVPAQNKDKPSKDKPIKEPVKASTRVVKAEEEADGHDADLSTPTSEAVSNASSHPPSRPLHPSLPPKPVTSMDTASSKRPSRVAESVHIRQPSKPSNLKPEPLFESGLVKSMHAPKEPAIAPLAKEEKTESSPERNGGLAASIHAPLPASQSVPSHLTNHPVSDAPPYLSPSSSPPASRSRPMGRGHRPPHSASVSHFPGHHSDPDCSGAGGAHHRTHSTPPTGPGTATAYARGGHATRPVITVDAISRLARTLGGTVPKRERDATPVSVVAAAKE